MKKQLSILLTLALLLSLFVPMGDANAAKKAKLNLKGEGKVLNIYCNNDEFPKYMVKYYPEYKAKDIYDYSKGGKIGNIKVKFTIIPSTDKAYQEELDKKLPKNKKVSANKRIDMFIVSSDFTEQYVNSSYTLPLTSIGVKSSVFKNQYDYTKEAVKDKSGKIKGSAWQLYSGGLIYNRKVAKKVLGTDSPSKVQKYVKNWSTYKKTAAKMAKAGIKMTATPYDSFRAYTQSDTWVKNGKATFGKGAKKWAEDSRALYIGKQTEMADLWSDTWMEGFKNNKVFCYFGPLWFVNFTVGPYSSESVLKTGWGVVKGPQAFFWGGNWMCVANGTDNKKLCADIISKLSGDSDVMKDGALAFNELPNNKAAVKSLAKNSSLNNEILKNQNPSLIFSANASKVKVGKRSVYDYELSNTFAGAMTHYIKGEISYSEAVKLYYDYAKRVDESLVD